MLRLVDTQAGQLVAKHSEIVADRSLDFLARPIVARHPSAPHVVHELGRWLDSADSTGDPCCTWRARASMYQSSVPLGTAHYLQSFTRAATDHCYQGRRTDAPNLTVHFRHELFMTTTPRGLAPRASASMDNSRNRHSAFANRICLGDRQSGAKRRGFATRTTAHRALEVATFSRFRP